jgi:hypothetical protein
VKLEEHKNEVSWENDDENTFRGFRDVNIIIEEDTDEEDSN